MNLQMQRKVVVVYNTSEWEASARNVTDQSTTSTYLQWPHWRYSTWF